ncbi:isopentenyl diphosphate isomerase/L-lactate dehydrogenase-like FMN-dependent dehydrogenase [Sphingomonas sp. SORGH_AS 950]|uniref:GSCFA domain-containing protein n=1 Tax=Sphingomonas sp. SORGH_AS_0950 TaxID=3041792 RepID=UPI0027893A94|nr:GSCFA domain-containing protein [Sphingomonas sp. SORGH_AS_0950]MDQ1159624.1 isopentenyl diphosphate isomerase/L-lactate dehydrogenase-like FMN-dependent dehydrogenase [Sphingomonas sp. SORGH_AS_0950]
MTVRSISGTAAWEAAARAPNARWKRQIDRFAKPFVEATITPKFSMSADDAVFCLGSCFARNIEEHLLPYGIDVLSRGIVSPPEEWPNRVNGFVNKFTVHSVRNELEWSLEPPTLDESYFEHHNGGWLDLQLSPFVAPVSLARAIERRDYLMRDYFARLRNASLVVLTLGLIEVWFDNLSGRHLNAAPSFASVRRDPGRYELCVTDVVDNIAELEKVRRLVLCHNSQARMIISVSPVPMSETFSGSDIIVANMNSKATLRVAAEMFARTHDDVDYFPSYDMVAMSPRGQAYEADCRHVSDEIVGQVVRTFLTAYLDSEVATPEFSERSYLAANPDVVDQLRRGELASGYEHWRKIGRDQGRPLQNAEGDGPPSVTQDPAKTGVIKIEDFKRQAKELLDPKLFDYIDGGAGDEITCASNSRDIDAIRFAPFAFRNVSAVDIRWQGALGEFSLPVGLSPSAFHELVCPEGEAATAAAAGEAGIPMVVSMLSSRSIEELASARGKRSLWLQTYLLEDRTLTESLIRRAEQAGFQAIVLSAGCAAMGRRDRNLTNGFTLPTSITAGNFTKGQAVDYNNPIHSFPGARPDPSATWQEVRAIVEMSRLPVIIKGIVNPADAAYALEAGVTAIIVSNHGGRQLDGTISTIAALPFIVRAVGGRVPILVDGGFRRGTDVVKALALGADAVLFGRATLWALAIGGQRGVTNAISLLRAEIVNTLQLLGCSSLSDVKANGEAILIRERRNLWGETA